MRNAKSVSWVVLGAVVFLMSTGVAWAENEATYNAGTGVVNMPKVAVGLEYYDVEMEQQGPGLDFLVTNYFYSTSSSMENIAVYNSAAGSLYIPTVIVGTDFFTVDLVQQGEGYNFSVTSAVLQFDTVTSSTGRVWMDRNLGASRVATSTNDLEAFGDLYQWGRGTDGHEKRTSSETSTVSSTDNPGHGDFILAKYSPYDWRSPQNDNFWQGVNGINNPCPAGFRLPTETEFDEERKSWTYNNSAGAFFSPLKLVSAGLRSGKYGTVYKGDGFYWCSTIQGNGAKYLDIDIGYSAIGMSYRAYGGSVRCIQD